MTAGSLGRSAHLEYALMGDAVNTAARLEAYAKTLRTQGAPACTILVGGATRARLGPKVTLRPVGEIGLRGKKEAVEVFEVIPASAPVLQTAEAYGRVGDATL
jgi:class 3 adenylate cyclase